MEINAGIDIIEIDRFEKICKKYNKRFVNKIFTPSERKYLKNDILKMAISFSLKEAIWKTLPEEIQKKTFFKDIKIGWKKEKPFLLNEIENYKFLLSYSISENYAITLVFMLRSGI
jgi:phosphopantetheine--protein transferase-like protein